MYTMKYIIESLFGKVFGDYSHPPSQTFAEFKIQLKRKIGGPVNEELTNGNGQEMGQDVLKTSDNMIVHGNLYQYWKVEAKKDTDNPNNNNVPIFAIDPLVLFTRNGSVYIAGQQNTNALWDNTCPNLLQIGGQQKFGNRELHRISIVCKQPHYNDWNTTVKGLHYSLHDAADPNINFYTNQYIQDPTITNIKALALSQGFYTQWVGDQIFFLPETLHPNIRSNYIPPGYVPVIDAGVPMN